MPYTCSSDPNSGAASYRLEPALRSVVSTSVNTHAANTGKSPKAVASPCSLGADWNACPITVMPTQSSTPNRTSSGTTYEIRPTAPVKPNSAIAAAFSAEYPARAPTAFQPGCPM